MSFLFHSSTHCICILHSNLTLFDRYLLLTMSFQYKEKEATGGGEEKQAIEATPGGRAAETDALPSHVEAMEKLSLGAD